MTDEELVRKRILKRIQSIADRPKNVTFSEIELIVHQLKSFHHVEKPRKTRHGVLFNIDSRRFMLSDHNPGRTQLKEYMVTDFLDAMADLGWYEE